jgi:hypothetical protein
MKTAMKNGMGTLWCMGVVCLLNGCAKPNATPGDTSKTFLAAVESTDADQFMSTLSSSLKEKIRATVPDLKKNMAEGSLKIKGCGGFKNLTPNYSVGDGASAVEGYTLIEYKGNCPSEKQYLKLVKQNELWLVDLTGPSVKQ